MAHAGAAGCCCRRYSLLWIALLQRSVTRLSEMGKECVSHPRARTPGACLVPPALRPSRRTASGGTRSGKKRPSAGFWHFCKNKGSWENWIFPRFITTK